MERHILLPTDFSDNAWAAAVYALKLYADETCTFHFLHSTRMKVSTMSNISNKLLRVMYDNAKKELTELKDMAETANANANHEFKVIVSPESLQEAIENAIMKHNIDLVVMGTKGATKAKEIFFGSNTVRMLKKMRSCPVLAIPDEFEFETPDQIAFPTDFNRFFNDTELKPLKGLADLHNSKIRIVSILYEKDLNETQDYNKQMLDSHLSNYPHTFHCMQDYAKKTVEINDFIDELGINILAMVNYKHSFIESIVKEPVIKKIGFRPIVPFFVIPG